MIKAEWTNKDTLDLQPTCNQFTTDCISRQAAIDAILHNQEVYSNNFGDDPIDKYTTAIISNDVQTIVQLPSAQPDADMIHLQKEQAYMQGWEDAKASAEPKTGGEIGRREHDDIVVEGINIYCPNCGYKTTIIGTVYKPERSRR